KAIQTGRFCHARMLTGTLCCDSGQVEADKIAKSGFASCRLIDERSTVHVGLGFAHPCLGILLRAGGDVVIRPTFAPYLPLPLIWAFFTNSRHWGARWSFPQC